MRAIEVAAVVLASGCASTYLHRAPPSPRELWPLPTDATRPDRTPAFTPDHPYTLPELIDLAESNNPDTRIGWEHARQAALRVGIANAKYLPIVSAKSLFGYQHTWFPVPHLSGSSLGINPFQLLPSINFPVPELPQPEGHVGVNTWQVLPFLAVYWDVFDPGRAAAVRAAKELSTAANALFTAEHERVMFDVARAYFRLNGARAQVAVSVDALERTRAIAGAANARFERGLATVVDTAEAQREIAQGEYDVAQARAAEIAVHAALVAAIGIDPQVPLDVERHAADSLPDRLHKNLDAYVDEALRTRADLRAAHARLPATEALESRSRALYLPRISVTGTGGAAVLGGSVDGFDLPTLTLPNLTVGVTFDWMLFDGGLRDVQNAMARSQHAEAVQQLEKLQHQVVQEVVTAYNEANASLSRYQSAKALFAAAATAEDAATTAYTNGLATLSDAMRAEKMRALAAAAKEQAYAEALVAMTALAFASGELRSVQAVPVH